MSKSVLTMQCYCFNVNQQVGENDSTCTEKEQTRARGRERDGNWDERNRRSHSRTSIGSRHSYRDDRVLDRKSAKEERMDRNSSRGIMNPLCISSLLSKLN